MHPILNETLHKISKFFVATTCTVYREWNLGRSQMLLNTKKYKHDIALKICITFC